MVFERKLALVFKFEAPDNVKLDKLREYLLENFAELDRRCGWGEDGVKGLENCRITYEGLTS